MHRPSSATGRSLRRDNRPSSRRPRTYTCRSLSSRNNAFPLCDIRPNPYSPKPFHCLMPAESSRRWKLAPISQTSLELQQALAHWNSLPAGALTSPGPTPGRNSNSRWQNRTRPCSSFYCGFSSPVWLQSRLAAELLAESADAVLVLSSAEVFFDRGFFAFVKLSAALVDAVEASPDADFEDFEEPVFLALPVSVAEPEAAEVSVAADFEDLVFFDLLVEFRRWSPKYPWQKCPWQRPFSWICSWKCRSCRRN